jgi:peptidoglycan hydrolase-like protein with peptidoglycan-binding domain
MDTGKKNRMLKGRIGAVAVTGITIVAGALVTLSTAAAPAATAAATTAAGTTASAHHAASQSAEAASGCVTEQFSESADQNTYEQCVDWEQVLLNDLWYYQEQHPNHEVPTYLGVNQLLSVDGYYGPDTTSDVTYFQRSWNLRIDGITGPQTWGWLCHEDSLHGYTGAYWHDVGCGTL